MKYNNDFKNYFEIAFLKENSIINPIVDNTSKFSTGTSNMPEIQIFIQDKLLDNDFKNIVDFLPIGFQNIEASISS